jgi:hypothetical protein
MIERLTGGRAQLAMKSSKTPRTVVLSLVVTLGLLSTTASDAGTLRGIATKGDQFSYLYSIVDVRIAHNELEDVARIFTVSKPRTQSVTQVLQLTVENRPPHASKVSRVMVWDLGRVFTRVDALLFSSGKVVIQGPGFPFGQLTCTYALRFDAGILSDTLEDQGCKSV